MLSNDEILLVSDQSEGTYTIRNRGYVERGQRAPSIQTLEQIAQALSIAPKALFEFSEDEESELLYDTLLAIARRCTPDDLRALIQVAKRLKNKSP